MRDGLLLVLFNLMLLSYVVVEEEITCFCILRSVDLIKDFRVFALKLFARGLPCLIIR